MTDRSLPTYAEIEQLHRTYAPTDAAFEVVFTHCKIVCDIAMQRIEAAPLPIDRDMVAVGCLLHDIGVYRVIDKTGKNTKPYITHGTEGEAILKSEGFAEAICRFASHHTGAGITKQEIITEGLPLPHVNYMADTLEEKLVMYADKFHSKSKPPHFNTWAWYRQYVEQLGEASATRFEELTALFGKPDLAPLIEKYGHAVRDRA